MYSSLELSRKKDSPLAFTKTKRYALDLMAKKDENGLRKKNSRIISLMKNNQDKNKTTFLPSISNQKYEKDEKIQNLKKLRDKVEKLLAEQTIPMNPKDSASWRRNDSLKYAQRNKFKGFETMRVEKKKNIIQYQYVFRSQDYEYNEKKGRLFPQKQRISNKRKVSHLELNKFFHKLRSNVFHLHQIFS